MNTIELNKMDFVSQKHALSLLKSICEIKRHPINFFSSPHSVKEFKQLIGNNKEMKRFLNNDITFTKKEITQLKTVADINLLFKNKMESHKLRASKS